MKKPLAIALLIITLTGCGWKGDPFSPPAPPPTSPPPSSPLASPAPSSSATTTSPTSLPPAGTGNVWIVKPAQMRFYPTTRFTSPSVPCELDLRVELLDELGDSIKASGDWRIELHTHEIASAGSGGGLPLLSWEIPMRTREQNHQYYDRITRSYQLRLKVDRMAGDQQPMWLTVTLMPPQGSRWQAQGLIDPQRGLLNP